MLDQLTPTGRIAMNKLEPLLALAEKRNVFELMINKPGAVWIDVAGRGPEELTGKDASWATPEWLEDVCQLLSVAYELPFDPRKGLGRLACQLPGGHRWHSLLGPMTRNGMAVAVRVKRHLKNPTWSNWGMDKNDPRVARLEAAVKAGRGVLVSGGTASGKTTLLNFLVNFIPRDWRMNLIEDVPEIDLPHPNRVEIFVSRVISEGRMTWRDGLDDIVRLKPDGCAIGEINMDNAYAFVRLINTGHDAAFSSIHATTPWGAFLAIRQNTQMSGMPPDGVLDMLVERIGFVVQVKRANRSGGSAERKITRVMSPFEMPEAVAMLDRAIGPDWRKSSEAYETYLSEKLEFERLAGVTIGAGGELETRSGAPIEKWSHLS